MSDRDSFTGRAFPDFQKQCQDFVELCHKAEGKRRRAGERGAGAAGERAFRETAKKNSTLRSYL